MKRRRSPVSISLVLIGSATLYGCSGDDPSRQDVYKTRADCQADWGQDAGKCQPARSGAHSHSGYYYGPAYSSRSMGSGGTDMPRANSRAIASTSVSRGGMGSSASSHSSSGS